MLRHLTREKISNRLGDLEGVSLESEVTGIEKPNLGIGNIAPESFRAGRDEPEGPEQSAGSDRPRAG